MYYEEDLNDSDNLMVNIMALTYYQKILLTSRKHVGQSNCDMEDYKNGINAFLLQLESQEFTFDDIDELVRNIVVTTKVEEKLGKIINEEHVEELSIYPMLYNYQKFLMKL